MLLRAGFEAAVRAHFAAVSAPLRADAARWARGAAGGPLAGQLSAAAAAVDAALAGLEEP